MTEAQVVLIVSGTAITTTISSLVVIWKLVMEYQIGIIQRFKEDLQETRDELHVYQRRFDRLLAWLRSENVAIPLEVVYADENIELP